MEQISIDIRDDSVNEQTSVKTGPRNFEQMLRDYEYEHPRIGQFLEGKIVHIEEEEVLLDIGSKWNAVVDRKDINALEEEYFANLDRGDQIPVCVIDPPEAEGVLMVSISKGFEQESWKKAERCLKSGEVLDLKVVDMNRGGLVVAFDRINGFVPNSHLPELQGLRSRAAEACKVEKIGSKITLKVIEVDRNQKRLILSEKAAQYDGRLRRFQEINPGDVLQGKVVNIVDYGVFVDMKGITGLLHVSELDWYRVDNPSDELEYGDEIEVLIKDVDLDRERISLSRKALLPNPWDSIEENYSLGDLVEGVVTSFQEYGVFVRLSDGITGLIHVSEMDGKPDEIVTLGQKILVSIIAIDPQQERIGLSLSRVSQD